MSGMVWVRAPASTANLGPGFDCAGLALDLWNVASFARMPGEGVMVESEGEGAAFLPRDGRNLIAQAFYSYLAQRGLEFTDGLQIRCRSEVPANSGLGSSATAILLGMLGADALLGLNSPKDEIFRCALQMENHGDNIGSALYGGLVACYRSGDELRIHAAGTPSWRCAVVVPDFAISTAAARAALPAEVSHDTAVFNIAQSTVLLAALMGDDLALLRDAVQDRLHQPRRLPLMPGAQAALRAAEETGAAVALSGAGPGLIAFGREGLEETAEAMQAAYRQAGLTSRRWLLTPSAQGAEVIPPQG